MKKFSIYTWKISMKFESNKFKFHLNYVIWRIHCESLSSAHQDQIPIIYGDSSHLVSASLLLFKLKIQCKPESASLFCFVFFFFFFPWIIYLWNLNDRILWISCSWNCFFYIFYLQIWPFMNWYLYNLYNGLIWMVLNSYSVVEITPISGLNCSKN